MANSLHFLLKFSVDRSGGFCAVLRSELGDWLAVRSERVKSRSEPSGELTMKQLCGNMKTLTLKVLVIGALTLFVTSQVLADDIYPPPWLKGPAQYNLRRLDFRDPAKPRAPGRGLVQPQWGSNGKG